MTWPQFLVASRQPTKELAKAINNPAKAQGDLLLSLLKANRWCEYGQNYKFGNISEIGQFREQVPVVTYEQIAPRIERIALGEANVLTTEPIVAFERTSGSSAGSKLIPYSCAAMEAFRIGILAWFNDFLTAIPEVAGGRAYFAISPATRAQETTPAGIPVGLPSEGAYFGDELLPAYANISVMPSTVGRIESIDDWEITTATYLAAATDLTLVSVWSPSFFSRIIATMVERASEVAFHIERGLTGLSANRQRAREFERSIGNGELDTKKLWPDLALVSAWKDGSSRRMAEKLAAQFPHAYFQGKGLLATEGLFTIPLCGEPWPIPALTSAFLEFADARGTVHLVHELREGLEYRLIVTTAGGLYRYDIEDVVECMDVQPSGLPLLRFMGRAGSVADLVGEKLTDRFVTSCLRVIPVYSALIPMENGPPRYILVIDLTEATDLSAVVRAVEAQLQRNPQYAYARKIGQLSPLLAIAVPDALHRFVNYRFHTGKRLGDIKPPSLITDFAAATRIWPEIIIADDRTPLSSQALA
jgi:hypothetical protein